VSEAADQRGNAADAGEATPAVSGAAVSSPGVGIGSDPKAAAAAGADARARPAGLPPGAAEGPEKPELYLAAAFAGAFLFARILKRIAH
jgi:hypothetical protein